MPKVEEITKGDRILAIVVRNTNSEKNLDFLTPKEFPLQVGLHNRPKGDYVKAHDHVPYKNLNIKVQEIFYVEKGKLLFSIYDGKEKYKEVIISNGEMILLNSGHSIKYLEDTRAIEIKQGPYREKENEKIYTSVKITSQKNYYTRLHLFFANYFTCTGRRYDQLDSKAFWT